MAEALTQNLKLIGRYSILRELRRDRHTVAYLAMDPVLNRELVLKAVQLHPRRDEESVGHERIEQAFMRQAQAAGRLHHPHIVTVHDAGDDCGRVRRHRRGRDGLIPRVIEWK